jgi:predicted transcriptional regulator
MSINDTVSNLGSELNKLFQKIEKLKVENQTLLKKNKELEEQLRYSSNEQGDTGELLVQYLKQLKDINQEDAEPKVDEESQYNKENIQEAKPDGDFM